jgi:hypothetical protein
MKKLTSTSRLCCLIRPEHICFDCGIRLCMRHYNYYSKKSGSFGGCRKYFSGGATSTPTPLSGVSGWGYCLNEVCPPCSKRCRVATGSVWCGLHSPNLKPDAPRTYRCPQSGRWGLNEQFPLEEFKTHLELCSVALDKHYVGIKDVIGLHRPATKLDI